MYLSVGGAKHSEKASEMDDRQQTYSNISKISLRGSLVSSSSFQKTPTSRKGETSKWDLSLKFSGGDYYDDPQISVVVSYIGKEIMQPASMEFNIIFENSSGMLVRSQKDIQTEFFGGSGTQLTRRFPRCELPQVPFTIQVDIQKFEQVASSEGQDKMLDLLTGKKYSDFVIAVKGTDIPVHRCILGISSSYFEGLLRSGMSEARFGRVELNHLTLDTARAMVDFIYIRQVNQPTVLLALNLLRASDMYSVDDLQQWCYQYLEQHLNKNSVLPILMSAHDFNHSQLKERCLNFLVDNRRQIEFNNHWKKQLGKRNELSMEVLEMMWK